RMAERHEPGRAEGWLDTAGRVRRGIERHLWSDEHGRYLRSISVASRHAHGGPLAPAYRHGLRYPNRPARSMQPVAERPDASPLGLLPEQVREDGSPVWVLPLTWSHAMFVLAARPELAAIADPRRLPTHAAA